MFVAIVLYNLKPFYLNCVISTQSLYNLENHENCIQFQKNYGESPPDYDQYFISQKLKYRAEKRRAGTISRQSPPSNVKFLSRFFTILNFLHPKAFKSRVSERIKN